MIRHLKFENFCSFRDSGELGLTTSAKTPTDDSFADSICGDKTTVLAGVFGPNAAGKTNLLKLPAFLNFFIRHSFQHGQADGSIPVDPFAGSSGGPTRLEIEFEGAGRVYRYAAELTRQTVMEERLSLRNPASKSFRTLLRRQAGSRAITLTQEDGFTDIAALKNLMKDRPDASMISAGLVTGRREFKDVMASLGRFETNVDRMGKAEVVQGILNQLSKEQIVFVQKDHDNVSHARRLCDLKGVRREENFFANYNAGRYEAIPEPERF